MFMVIVTICATEVFKLKDQLRTPRFQVHRLVVFNSRRPDCNRFLVVLLVKLEKIYILVVYFNWGRNCCKNYRENVEKT